MTTKRVTLLLNIHIYSCFQERLTLGYHRPPTSITPGFISARQNSKDETPQWSEQNAQAALDRLVDLLRLGGATPEPTHNIDAARWRKVLWYVQVYTGLYILRERKGTDKNPT